MFQDRAAYKHAREARVLIVDLFSRLYEVAEERITLMFHERALSSLASCGKASRKGTRSSPRFDRL